MNCFSGNDRKSEDNYATLSCLERWDIVWLRIDMRVLRCSGK